MILVILHSSKQQLCCCKLQSCFGCHQDGHRICIKAWMVTVNSNSNRTNMNQLIKFFSITWKKDGVKLWRFGVLQELSLTLMPWRYLGARLAPTLKCAYSKHYRFVVATPFNSLPQKSLTRFRKGQHPDVCMKKFARNKQLSRI